MANTDVNRSAAKKSAASKNTKAPVKKQSVSANSKKKTAHSEDKKKKTLRKEVIFLVILAICVLMFIACFSETLLWLRKITFTLFGNLMYAAPFIIAGLAFFFVMNDFTGKIAFRLFGFLVLLFGISGIFSLASVPEKGGLLGRANYALFYKGLGVAGTYIVDVFVIVIGLILTTGFSFSDIISTLSENTEKKENDIERQNAKIKRQKMEEEHRHERLEKQEKELQNVELLKRENDKLANSNTKRAKQLQNEDRFRPILGIGDTTIREDGTDIETTFRSQEETLKQNEKIFKVSAGSYKNSGNVKTTEDKAAKDVSFIPDIKVPNSYFNEDEPGEVKLTMQDEAEKNRVNIVKREDKKEEEPKYKLDESDDYIKTVITANGKIIRAEVDGDVLSKKTVINEHEGEDFFAKPAKDSYADEEVQGTEKEEVHTVSADEKVSKTTAKENLQAAKEIEKSIQKEPDKEYVFPPIRLLKRGNAAGISKSELNKELTETAQKLQQTLKTFGVGVTITNITCGPTVTCYEIQPEMGVKVSKIVSLTDDIKLNLAAADIRIEAPIPGKSAIGIEIPNKVKQSVVLRDLLESETWTNAKSRLAFAAGRDIEGNTIVGNIEKMPHVLVAGATGSGKSVCINSIIMSILYHAKPTEVKMILVDPKVVELSVYNGIPHLLLPVVTDPKKAAAALNWAVAEMENRYMEFAKYGVRNVEGFNDMIFTDAPEDDGGNPIKAMPQILIIVDELADLMMVAANEVETAICRLAQKARAAGIHLVLATQRPSVDVITGLIKANIPSRIAFAVSSGTDSRTILDTVGAEKLLGMGDMLYAPAGASKPIRLQGTYVSDEEVGTVVDYLKNQGEVKGGVQKDIDLSNISSGNTSGGNGGSGGNDRDEFFADAGRLVIEKEKASIGMLQRAFKLGFNRAARIVDQLCEAGVVGEEEGTKPRRVLMNPAEFEEYLKNQ